MNKKSIDELFRERFREFDEVPDEKVWKAIKASLEKKKSRKVIPIWWKLGGIAAVLSILMVAINPFEKTTEEYQNQVTETKSKDPIEQNPGIKTSEKDADFKNLGIELVEENDQNASKTEEEILKEAAHPYANSAQKDKLSNTSSKKEKKSLVQSDKNSALVQENTSTKTTKKSDAYAQTKNIKTHEATKGSFKDQLEEKEALAQKDANTNGETASKIDFNAEKSKNSMALNEELKIIDKKEAQKKSIFEAINDQEEVILADNTNEKWSVGPSVAPVYFNGIGEGSPVHTIFVPNSKSGNINMSYGVSVAYEVSKKLKVRSGVHKVDYGYTTNQVSFSPSARAETPQVQNIDYAASAKGIVVSSRVNPDVGGEFSPLTNAFDTTAKAATLDGNLSQQFGYLEVPLELNYAVLDTRFGINVIGGVSSLFLIDNSVLLNSGDQTTEMGEANNINDLNFSTNIGFGLNYKFSPKLQFNIEPIFKYQLNTFSNIAGDFRPFSVGVYSGFNLRF
ncbi:outer membrane beta-barrel protein [Cellulophaga sp. Hel_I_12]|uniref:outer membrane beta-barrel protein n=1 Tax=Cellulophaga sp. Hel_I_12 TaxID=1249972 RepID=UPI0006482FDF|nr:outer membrane beta-barrel protein [Cellulophaga sp. Hel_I_12]